jgi:catechol 2,3-dioxygenase-like lactoylglutathione lyase family enzyme
MQFRYARHTNNLNVIIEFYTNVLGLEKLGNFENHSNYNGVFLGLPNLDWHLEFTESNEKVGHNPNEDDLIVFYLKSKKEFNDIRERAEKFKVSIVKSKNPYWQTNGIELRDPDGFGVILTL